MGRRGSCLFAQSLTGLPWKAEGQLALLNNRQIFLKYGYRHESKGLCSLQERSCYLSLKLPRISPAETLGRAQRKPRRWGAGCLLTSALALPVHIACVYLPFLEGNGA